jgi:hypothetical protein
MVSHSYTRRWIGFILVNSYYLYLKLQEFMFVDFDIENSVIYITVTNYAKQLWVIHSHDC